MRSLSEFHKFHGVIHGDPYKNGVVKSVLLLALSVNLLELCVTVVNRYIVPASNMAFYQFDARCDFKSHSCCMKD